ncbi:MAG: hemolysin family protein [Acidimicrobiia bacterium]|nr:hemolysin family protein [Acidimicrobiia bacterium]MDH3463518.1 hemolysin family protein [Acidimicrobiia bacterium]
MNWTALLWLVLLLIANGFFVAAEFSFITARRNVLEEREGRSSKVAVGLNKNLSLSLAGAQLGITMASLALGAVAEPAIAGFLEAGLGLVGLTEATKHAIALVVALLIVVFLHMVIGEMAPKNIAISSPEPTAIALALPFRAFIVVFRPLIAMLNGTANLVLRLFGVQPADALEVGHSAEDLAIVIGAGQKEGVIGEFAHNLLTGAIVFGNRDASEVMTPRPDVIAAEVDDSAAAVLQLMQRTGHSRILIHTGDLDDVIGFVHIKDLISTDPESLSEPVSPEMIRLALAVPESASLQSVLTSMRRARSHIGIVVDEHGSAAGIVTMEDIAEELVGDIADEHDLDEQSVRVVAPGELIVAGNVRIDDLKEFDVELPEGEYTTVGGYVMNQLGRIPRRGDLVESHPWELRVQTTSGRRVGQVSIKLRTDTRDSAD